MSDETVRVPAADILALAEKWDYEGITCECGHYVGGDHNGNGCYAVVTYSPLVRCTCKLTDGQREDEIAAAQLRALVDAAERPDEGEAPERVCAPRRPCVSEHGDAAKCRKCYPAPAAPVGDPLCKCGHAKDQWHPYGQCAWPCPCPAFTPAPLSSPRRTRDEGTEDEAEAAWREWIHECPHLCNTDRCSFIAGFRAARLAGEDDQ